LPFDYAQGGESFDPELTAEGLRTVSLSNGLSN